MSRQLNVVVACERSGKVRDAFNKLGHFAISVDTEPGYSGEIGRIHYQQDILSYLAWSKKLQFRIDLLIGHPPCTYLCNSGVSWLRNRKDAQGNSVGFNAIRWRQMVEAKRLFESLWNLNIPHIAIENPIPHGYAALPKYSQIIQPYMFGHPERKATCLWLKNLPLLEPNGNWPATEAKMKKLPKKLSQRLHYASPGPNRARIRSETFQGIADAMADQWSRHILTQ